MNAADILYLQRALNATGLNESAPLSEDGLFGPETERALRLFQAQQGLVVDGMPGPRTWAALQQWDDGPARITPEDLQRAAAMLRVDLPAIRAIVSVESRGTGFLPGGDPVILFERHIMRRRLLLHGVPSERVTDLAAQYPNLVNSRRGGYYGGQREHARLADASGIHQLAALESASWGLFQVMGFHAARLGYGDAARFAEAMSRSEGEQLGAFVRFIEADETLHEALQQHNWALVARRYNGPAYASHGYHTRLQRAYERWLA